MYCAMSVITEDASIPIRFLVLLRKIGKQPTKRYTSTSGMQLVTSGSLSEIVIIREGLNCQSQTEVQYYSGNDKLY